MDVLVVETDDPIIAKIGWYVGVRDETTVILMAPGLSAEECRDAAAAAILGTFGPVRMVAV